MKKNSTHPSTVHSKHNCSKKKNAKYGRYESRVKSEGHLYLPIVFEYYGGMSDDAVDLNAAKCEYENK